MISHKNLSTFKHKIVLTKNLKVVHECRIFHFRTISRNNLLMYAFYVFGISFTYSSISRKIGISLDWFLIHIEKPQTSGLVNPIH